MRFLYVGFGRFSDPELVLVRGRGVRVLVPELIVRPELILTFIKLVHVILLKLILLKVVRVRPLGRGLGGLRAVCGLQLGLDRF